jgi:hypothetical protein
VYATLKGTHAVSEQPQAGGDLAKFSDFLIGTYRI